ncbi:hypothetical protein V500_04957 [Pseudogymnoascus sp. VKM F-4518 (FW-2643)]|nr:hypothetical protein V500_04957 [Pseudogymnoascus sp. VKM F-4518 (FW-2643)]
MAEALRGRLPNEPFFVNLLKIANEIKHVIIHDPQNRIDADYSQLLTDVLRMQLLLKQSLPESMFDDALNLLQVSNPYILILSGKYEFIIAALSIMSIGGAFAPLASRLLPEEAFYMLQTSRAICILADQQHLQLAEECQGYAASQGISIPVLPISISNPPSEDLSNSDPCFEIDRKLTVEPHRPALILFTSGTSGPPKGVVHTRRLFYDIHTSSSPSEVFLSHDAIHWGSSLVTFVSSVLGGARTEIIPQNAEAIWERLREGGATTLGCAPRIWTQMMRHFEDHLSLLPTEKRIPYVRGAQSLSHALTRGSMPEPSVLQFWRDLGKRLHVCYGITELGATVMKTTSDTDVNLERCIGRPMPGITVKLSSGSHGEMLIKKSVVFSHYLNDHGETAASFDSDGFYKTGDLARRVGSDYILEGRASTDFIRCQGLRVPILEVEMRLLQLPFISEGCILQASDAHNGQIVAALVRLRNPEKTYLGDSGKVQRLEKPYLQVLRNSLGGALPTFMLPTALRILQDEEEIPRTPSLKVIRGKAAEQYFPRSKSCELLTNVEVLDLGNNRDSRTRKVWDWGGLL